MNVVIDEVWRREPCQSFFAMVFFVGLTVRKWANLQRITILFHLLNTCGFWLLYLPFNQSIFALVLFFGHCLFVEFVSFHKSLLRDWWVFLSNFFQLFPFDLPFQSANFFIFLLHNVFESFNFLVKLSLSLFLLLPQSNNDVSKSLANFAQKLSIIGLE